MYTNEQLSHLLKILKKNNGLPGSNLNSIVESQLKLYDYSAFISHMEGKGYIFHDNSSKYYITKSGRLFIIKQDIVQFATKPISFFILAVIALIIAYLSLIK